MTNIEFIDKLMNAQTTKNCYALGCFGQVMTKEFINQKANQYPTWYSKNRDKITEGSFGFDCICFIKGILWGWTPSKQAKYQSNNVPDVNESGMLDYCYNVSSNFSTIKKGEYLYRQGHCGVYIGNGYTIECTTSDAYKIRTAKLSDGNWEKHGELQFIDYIDNPTNIYDILDEIEKLAYEGKRMYK